MKRFLILFFLTISMHVFSQNIIRINQIGFPVSHEKFAIIADEKATDFELRNAQNDKVVFQGKLSDARFSKFSEEYVKYADFTEYKTRGTYYLYCNGNKSNPFTIQDKIYQEVSQASIRAFYYWRASTELLPQHATWHGIDFSRPLGHADTEVKIHKSAATQNRPAGTIVSAPKGWYDAGDYNLYVVNAGISFHSLAFAYELFPEYYKSLNLNLPESGNGVPDILNELKWELDWLFAMQDEDGGVYTKLSSLRFCSMIMPHEDNLERYMIGKSTAAALDFAAMMAMASRIYKQYESIFPDISKKALTAAKKAWNWAKENPAIYFKNPSDVHTGGYGDVNMKDEFFWAASELFITTGEEKFLKELDFNFDFYIPTWGGVETLGLMSLVAHKDMLKDPSVVEQKFFELAQKIATFYNESNHCIPVNKFDWGSNGMISSAGALAGLAKLVLKDSQNEQYHFEQIMQKSFDYILGANPTGYCFVSGFGTKYPRHFHDRRCTSDGIEEPIPGYLAGGSTNYVIRDCGEKGYPSLTPAGCYRDAICSFSTNEIAINWNGPFAMLAGMVENIE